MLLDTFELREDAREKFRSMLHAKLAREKVTTQDLIAFCTRNSASPATHPLRITAAGAAAAGGGGSGDSHSSRDAPREARNNTNNASNSTSAGCTPLVAPGETTNNTNTTAAAGGAETHTPREKAVQPPPPSSACATLAGANIANPTPAAVAAPNHAKAAPAPTDKKGKAIVFVCWLCGTSSFCIYRIKNGFHLCFPCFRLFYLGVVLPLIDSPGRRASDKDLLARIQLLQEAEAAASADRAPPEAAKANSPLLHATTTQTATGRRERVASAAETTTTPLEVTEPGQASFVMNASVMLQRRNASRGAASQHASPMMANSNNNTISSSSDGAAGAGHALAEELASFNQTLTTTSDKAAHNNNNSSSSAGAEASMLFDTLSERQARASLPEWERVRPVHSMWNCPRCTFINPEYAKQCEVCGFRNPSTVRCPLCGALCSIASTSAIRGTSRAKAALAQPLCRNGLPHVVWCCTRCNAVNTTDGEQCLACHSPHYWICAYCTERHTAAADVDGLRYCPTCGSYNTPEDLHRGMLKLEEESKQVKQTTAAAANQNTTTTNTNFSIAAAQEDIPNILVTSSSSNGNTNHTAAAPLVHVQSAPPINTTTTNNANNTALPSPPSPSSLHAESVHAKSQPGFPAATSEATEIVFGVNDADTIAERVRQEEILRHKERLARRLRRLGKKPNTRKSDGNCLFAALANQLFGRPSLCHTVRAMVVHYMRSHAEDYAVLFTETEWQRYITQMREPEFWGDELCLNAAARCFHIDIHVITSDATRWHIVFHHKDLSQSQSHRRLLLPTPSVTEGTSEALTEHRPTKNTQGTTNSTIVGGDGGAATHAATRALLPSATSASAAQPRPLVAVMTSGGQRCEVVLPQRGESDAVCVFLAYLYPVHYDDVGDDAGLPLKLPDLFATEMVRVLSEAAPLPPLSNSSSTSSATNTNSNPTQPPAPAISASVAVKEKSAHKTHRGSGTGALLDKLFSSATSKPSSASSKRAGEETTSKSRHAHEH